MSDTQAMLAIGVMALVTFFLRALPFIAFRNKSIPHFIEYLGKYLPYAVMALLVVYCLKGISFTGASHGIPEIIAVCAVVLLHVWKKNTILSVVAGTAIYMVLIRIF